MATTANENTRNEGLEEVRSKAKWAIDECLRHYDGLMKRDTLDVDSMQAATSLLRTIVEAGRLKCDRDITKFCG